MRLTYTCSACKKRNYLKEKENTRADLQYKIGDDEVKVNCDNCGKMDKKHLNRITAVADSNIVILGTVFGVLITGILWLYVGLIATIVCCVPIIVWRHENEKAHGFNSYAIKRK